MASAVKFKPNIRLVLGARSNFQTRGTRLSDSYKALIGRSYSHIANIPKIAVVGAGPAGLTLARLLQHLSKSPLSVTVLEADSFPDTRDQGGSLDLHADGGQAALESAGLLDEFRSLARPEGEVLKIFLPNGQLIMDEGSDPEAQGRPREMHDRPEIDRRLLRKLLIDSLAPGTIQWDTKVSRVQARTVLSKSQVDRGEGGDREVFDIVATSSSSDHIELNGFDLVVGADGAWSQVRPLLTTHTPFFSGIAGLDVRISAVDASRPDEARRCGAGMCLTLGPNRGILSQRSGGSGKEGEVRTYAFVRMEAEWLDQNWQSNVGIDWSDMDAAIPAFMDKFFPEWDESARNMVLNADRDTAIPRNMWMLEPGLRWDSRPGITLLGDAAHVMTPFAGVGVNVAMQDALYLARQILTSQSHTSNGHGGTVTTHTLNESVAQAVLGYETEMFGRAEKYARQTLMYLDLFFHERGGVAMVEHFDRIKEAERKKEQAVKMVTPPLPNSS